ncbi:unnamed protein product [Rhizophagus irregularis]|nr:unnamed protein product [Rhizophagus irregularis]
MDSPIVQAGIKKRLKKISDNISDAFEGKDIVEFFAELDKEFEAISNCGLLKRESTSDQSNYIPRKRQEIDFNEERTIKEAISS